MQDVPAFDADWALWISLGVWGLGWLFLLPIWWRNWRVSRGANLPITEADVTHQTITRWLLLTGTISTVSSLLFMASRALPFAVFMALCLATGLAGFLAALALDARRARH